MKRCLIVLLLAFVSFPLVSFASPTITADSNGHLNQLSDIETGLSGEYLSWAVYEDAEHTAQHEIYSYGFGWSMPCPCYPFDISGLSSYVGNIPWTYYVYSYADMYLDSRNRVNTVSSFQIYTADGVNFWTKPLTLGSPLSGTLTVSGYEFGNNWQVTDTKCPADPSGVWKLHTGTDYTASENDSVYAAEAGVVKHKESHGDWASHIVIEHTHPDGWKYTTVYWHVNPVSGLNVNDTVTKGQEIATIAYLTTGSHLHFGVRIGDYVAETSGHPTVSGVGALPVNDCTNGGNSYPAFPNGFVDTDSTKGYIQYQ